MIDCSYFREKETSERNVNKNTLIHRLPEDSTNKTVPAEVMSYGISWESGPRFEYAYRICIPSVAYACGFGYNSLFLLANHKPRSVSNTSLQREVKNSLNTPPPSIPALERHIK